MDSQPTTRLLSIGEFAAATQLSAKALRLYDEHCILRPAVVDSANGYRYYRDDQVPIGRLIRTLRDMELPLAGVFDVVSALKTARAEMLLRQFAAESDRRVARQRRAYQAALELLRTRTDAASVVITERPRPATTIAVRPFVAERRFLLEGFRAEVAAGFAALADQGLTPAGEAFCVLVEPVSDDEGQLEAAIPLAASVTPKNISTRQLPAHRCAVLPVDINDTAVLDWAASLDALFDWFDRRGYRAAEPPIVSFIPRDVGLRVEVAWAFESVDAGPTR